MGKTKFQQSWVKEFPWVTQCRGDTSRAWCTICDKSFKIDASGRSQVVSHQKCHSLEEGGQNEKKTKKKDPAQRVFETSSDGRISMSANTGHSIDLNDKILRAEIYQALHITQYNHSFASASQDSKRFQYMFSDSAIASGYSQSDSKVKYQIQYGIAPYCKEKLIYDVKKRPYTFKFDETTNKLVDKQYDGYIQYWSDSEHRVVNRYCGSLFIGHCNSSDLVDHFNHFMMEMELDTKYLLHLGMDGPNVNLCFQEKLMKALKESLDKTFLNLGTCSLHPVHTAFRKGIKSMSYDVDQLFTDLHFFFKLSSARREDYNSLHTLTDVLGKFAKKHAETRWLSMKFVAVRVVEQWVNLTEYFLKFLPKQKGFRQVEKTERYQRIRDSLQEDVTLAYVAFTAFVSSDFETFLLPFQSSKPMIHVLYTEMERLLGSLLNKFIKSKYIKEPPVLGLHTLGVTKEKYHKPLTMIDVGTKVKCMLAKSGLLTSETQQKLREDCLSFYVNSVSYLQKELPFDNTFLKHAQYLHPEKRCDPSSLSGVSNLALSMTRVLKHCLPSVFNVSASETEESICDRIRSQWRLYQTEAEALPEFSKDDQSSSKTTRVQPSYWAYALGVCGIEKVDSSPLDGYRRLDEYWHEVGLIKDNNGQYKYSQLVALMKAVLSISHGNAVPERGFSVNKIMLEAHGWTIQNDTIAALRLVKDAIRQHGGATEFPITRKLLDHCAKAHEREVAHRRTKEAEAKKQEQIKLQQEAATLALKAQKDEVNKLESQIATYEVQLKAADEIIVDGTRDLTAVLDGSKGKVDRQSVQAANSKIQIGLGQKRSLEEKKHELEVLLKKEKKKKSKK